MKKEAYEVEYYEPKSVLAMQADRREEKHWRKQKKGIRAVRKPVGFLRSVGTGILILPLR